MSLGYINKILIFGSLGHDPELRYTPKGNAVVTLSVATNRNFKNSEGEQKEEVHWHKATVWGKRAEACAKHLVKGSKVFLEGELQMKSWTDKEGITRKSAEIMVNSITFVGGNRADLTGVSVPIVEIPAMAH